MIRVIGRVSTGGGGGGNGNGSVSSVGFSVGHDSTQTVAGQPITTSGTIRANAANGGASDVVVGWDASANSKIYFALGANLTTNGNIIDAVVPSSNANVTHSGTLTANQLIIGNGGGDITVLGNLGSNTTVLHGNATGAPTFGLVNLSTDVTGSLNTLINAQTGTSYTVVAGDKGKLLTFSNGNAVAVLLPQATGSFTTGFSGVFKNDGAGTVTVTPTTSTIGGAATLVLTTGQSCGYVSDGTNYETTPGQGSSGGGGAAGPPTGRLTLTTGIPIPSGDVTGATNIFYTPFVGNTIGLWDGAAWTSYTYTEITLPLGTLTNTLPYDIFARQVATVVTLDVLAWANVNARATAITLQDGRYCKSGDKTRLYLGTFFTTATTTTEDSEINRYLWNMYNQVRREAFKGVSSSHLYNSNTERDWNGSATDTACNAVIGLPGYAVDCRGGGGLGTVANLIITNQILSLRFNGSSFGAETAGQFYQTTNLYNFLCYQNITRSALSVAGQNTLILREADFSSAPGGDFQAGSSGMTFTG